ncbi:uncharacterized protein HKW66_Vig0007060 [Vigna angularis]|uniref:Uncharacterized protein n=1 Tax=Phaseolus angularis TaxID=3914 RepID=A0A8T0LEZ5_PHAAN|nr:uncharacterized protein HKW66_Vig0007060 [Vigna angularis]
MTTCLEIGGLEIPFDESVVGLVAEMFNSKTTTLKDLTDMFNVIVNDKNIEVDVLNLEWFVRKQDRHLPEICAAFHMDDGGMGEGSLAERSRERIRKNNLDIIALNAKIGVLTRELFEICQTPILNEEGACSTDEEVGGGVDEAPEVGGDEEPAGGRYSRFEEEGVDEAAEDPVGAFNEVGGDDKTAHEYEIVSGSHHQSVCIEIDDDGDDDE